MIVECLYRHILLKDACTNVKTIKKNLHTKFETIITHPCMDNKTSNLVCELQKSMDVIHINQIH